MQCVAAHSVSHWPARAQLLLPDLSAMGAAVAKAAELLFRLQLCPPYTESCNIVYIFAWVICLTHDGLGLVSLYMTQLCLSSIVLCKAVAVTAQASEFVCNKECIGAHLTSSVCLCCSDYSQLDSHTLQTATETHVKSVLHRPFANLF